jgi:hypothetical protein
MALDPTVVPNLNLAVANFAAQIAEMSANPRPSYTVGDQSFDWTQYLEYLTRNMKAVQQLIQSLSPFQNMSVVRT